MSLFPEYFELKRTPSCASREDGGAFPRRTMNRIVMDYLITEGFKDAAEKFRTEAGFEDDEMMPPESIDIRIKIREAVRSGQIAEATSLVHQHYPELLDDDRALFFKLQQQQLIELIRENRVGEALQFASEHLADRGEEDPRVLSELERTMALLAFENPALSPFSDLLSDSHREKVASQLNAAILTAEHAPHVEPKLANVLKLILWSQEALDKKKIKYSKMTDLATGRTQETK